MKKRLLPLLLLLLILSACSGGGTTPTAAKAPETTLPETEAPVTTEAPVFEPVVLLDGEGCAFTLTDVTLDEVWGYTFYFLCENRSDFTQLFQIPEASCQGWLLTPDWMQSVSPGETRETHFNIWLSDLARCELESLEELNFRLTVRDFDNYGTEPFADERLRLSPADLVTEQLKPGPTQIAGPEQVIADNDLFTFTIRGRDEDNIWTYNLNLYIENKSEQDLVFSWQDVQVNGVPADPWLYCTVPAGLRTCFNLYFNEDDMQAKEIDAIKTVDFRLKVTPTDSFSALYSEAHSYTAP